VVGSHRKCWNCLEDLKDSWDICPSCGEKQLIGAPVKGKFEGPLCRVLIVDDSMIISRQLSQILSPENGFEIVATANDGAKGLKKYQELHPNIDLVLLDITMPVMDGVEVLEKILKFDEKAVVIMTSMVGNDDVVKKCIHIGARHYIVKPLDNHKVMERVLAVVRPEALARSVMHPQ
jgi:two-component system chemotaxis response regulator CheY